MSPGRWLAACGALLMGAGLAGAAPPRPVLLDDFGDAKPWVASASDQVQAALRRDADGSLCLDYDFAGVSGYAVMRRALPQRWPERFDITARIKSSGAVNDFQFKLVDASGDNVWWVNRPNSTGVGSPASALPSSLADLKLRRRHIEFAWGPTADRALRQTQFVEFVVAAGREGGKGSLCLARLALAERAPDPVPMPEPTRSVRGRALFVDLGAAREFNGLALQWPAGAGGGKAGFDYEVSASDDSRRWQLLRSVRGSDGGLDALYLPESEARHLRITLPPSAAAGSAPALALRSAAEWPSFNAVLASQALALPRGDLPRAFVGEQNYWTLVGVDGGGDRSGLISEDGAIEVGRGGFSLDPVVLLPDGQRISWAQVQPQHSLREGHLPLPRVRWRHSAVWLDVEAAADGPRDAPELLARYTLHNPGPQAQTLTLLLALRPWQVNPPQQFLATQGGASAVRSLKWDGRVLQVNGQRVLRWTEPPQRVSALGLDGGLSLSALQAAPVLGTLDDVQGHASAALQWRFTLAPGASQTVGMAVGLGGGEVVNRVAGHHPHPNPLPQAGEGVNAAASPSASRSASTAQQPAAMPALPPHPLAGEGRGEGAHAPQPQPQPLTPPSLNARFEATATHWRQRLNRVQFQLPTEARPIVDTLRTSLAHMLISRQGPALQPGTRSYARSWVRDGAMMVAGLVRLGEVDAAREFTDWFAGYIFASGKVPCCVDARGADPVVENDSHGQYLYAVAEVWRHTQDRAFLQRHAQHIQRVMGWLEALRQSERSAANRAPGREHLFGLMPPSISHEGYSDKPAYSNWDNFWALRGYKDAVLLARALEQPALAEEWARWRDEFERELQASIKATARHYGANTIAGAADRGDFDATSTTIALNPAQAAVPADLLAATFERYWQEMHARSQGQRLWRDYTPYELRAVGALTRLGQPERAHAMLDFFFADQRPQGWNQWAEVVLPNPREPRFLGDMPHAWVSSDYIRSALDLFAFDREADDTLVIGAGLKPEWLRAEGGVQVAGLATPQGPLHYSLRPQGTGWLLELPAAAADVASRAGRLVLRWPGTEALPQAWHQGRLLSWRGRELALPAAPAQVLLEAPALAPNGLRPTIVPPAPAAAAALR